MLFLQVVAGPEFLVDQALKDAAYPGCILMDNWAQTVRTLSFPLPRKPS